MSQDNRDIDALLRQPSRGLPPPAGAWETVRRRARRRRWAKLGAAAAAGAVVTAGAVPAVLAVRNHRDDQRLSVTSGRFRHTTGTPPRPSRSPTAATLAGFHPRSVSFVTQSEGFLWGSVAATADGVLVRTTDGGRTWTRIPAPTVDATDPGGNGASDVRFANGRQGFIFGTGYYATQDGGQTWTSLPAPGHIDALETMNGRVWALVRSCRSCQTVRLYTATPDDPALRPATEVPPLHGRSAAIAVNGASVDVLAGAADLWTSPDGVTWSPAVNPCGQDFGSDGLGNAVATWAPGRLAVVCGGQPSAGSQIKEVFTSSDGGRQWSTGHAPAAVGYVRSLSAGTGADLVVGTVRGGALVSVDGGRDWTAARTGRELTAFVGFISSRHLVAVGDPDAARGTFLTSDDAGRSWRITRFPR